jgi:ubiquinone/menaquinone biosynthesis C-methylase UbiE
MARPRIVETNEGIQDETTVEVFDAFARGMRDRGWNHVDSIIGAGIRTGHALEIGPGPGYVGLEWLRHTESTTLTGCEISPAMLRLSITNAADYGLTGRTRYVESNGMCMPFENCAFDAVFSSGSLHEWENPIQVFDEIYRVLKPGGLFCITDMRRDVSPILARLIYVSVKPKEIRPGFITSLNASYTPKELEEILRQSLWKNASVQKDFFGLRASGQKPG